MKISSMKAIDMKGNPVSVGEKVLISLNGRDLEGYINFIVAENRLSVDIGEDIYVNIDSRKSVWIPE